MRGYFEVNYCVYIGNYRFIKTSIIGSANKSNEYTHMKSQNQSTYDVFYKLFPILEELGRKNISIEKCWNSWHPLNPDKKMPKNEYDKYEDEFYTGIYKKWLSENNG